MRLTAVNVSAAMQVDSLNPMTGIDGRTALLSNLAKALRANSSLFGPDARPGNLLGELVEVIFRHLKTIIITHLLLVLDFLHYQSIPAETPEHKARIHMSTLWTVLIDGLAPIWPQS